MKEKLPKILLVLVLTLILVNLGYFDYKLFFDKKAKTEQGTEIETETEQKKNGAKECAEDCQQLIDEKVNEAVARISTQTVSEKIDIAPTSRPGNLAKVVYIPLVTSGSAASITWADIVPSEFYFDLGNFPGAKEVRLEAYLLSINNDLGYARIFDDTNKKEAYSSEVQTNSSTFTRVESSPMVISRGNNKYTVQLRSVNATQVQIKDAKLKIIF